MHTDTDLAYFAANSIDPEGTQPRERPVPCMTCKRLTFNQMGGCDAHYVERKGAAAATATRR